MAQLLANIKQRFFDDNGEPLVGGKLYSYDAGTSTPRATFTDQSGMVANDNPIILDSAGKASVWLDNGAYKFVLTDALDIVLDTVDDVSTYGIGTVVTATIADGAVTSEKIGAGEVKTINILDNSITTPKINNDAVTTPKIVDSGVTTLKIADLNVTTAKIANGAITQAKRASLNYVLSAAGSAAFTTNSTTYIDVTGLTVTITTTGRPVEIKLVPYSSTQFAILGTDSGSSASSNGTLSILKNGAAIGYYNMGTGTTGGATSNTLSFFSNLTFMDFPAAGTYTYKFQAKATTGTSNINVNYCKLLAYEL